MSLSSTLRFIAGHPLSRANPLAAVGRFGIWQLRARLGGEIELPWIDGARLVARRGMTGATGNIYCGLHEFPEMAFLLHLLQPGDLFLDVGANVGSYTVLASAVCGARSIAFEPDPGTAAALLRNVTANGVEGLVRIETCALGDRDGEISFTVGLDTVNRVAEGGGALPTRQVAVRRLDAVMADEAPVLIKLDVEGFEREVLNGAGSTLAKPSLLAVQSELDNPEVTQALAGAGFAPRYYDPLTRSLSLAPCGYKVSNMIFVREDAGLEQRLKAARRRRVHGVEF